MQFFQTSLGDELAQLRVMLQDKLAAGEDDSGATYTDADLLRFIKRALYSLVHTQITVFSEDENTPADTESTYKAIAELTLDDRDAKLPIQSGYILELDKLVLQWVNLVLSPDTRGNLFMTAPISSPRKPHDTIEEQRRF